MGGRQYISHVIPRTVTGGAANTEVTLTIDGAKAVSYVVLDLDVGFDIAVTAVVDVTIEVEGGTVIYRIPHDFSAGALHRSFTGAIRGSGAQGLDVIIRLPAVTGAIGRISAVFSSP